MQKIIIESAIDWYNLRNNIISNKIVHIKNCGDIQPFPNGPIFENAELIYIENCHKNFLFFWLNSYTFPNAKEIYLNTHPCSQYVLYRVLENTDTVIYINSSYSHYLNIWKIKPKNIKIFTDSNNNIFNKIYSTENIDSMIIIN